MNQTDQYDIRRNELLKEVGDKIKAITNGIAERKQAIVEAQARSRDHGDFQRHHEAQQENLKASQLHELNRHDEAKLRELHLKQHEIASGNHPELASLSQVCVVRENTKKHAELDEAKEAFDRLMTPELKAAAQRYVGAMKMANPLLPAPHLAEIIAKEA